MFYLSWHCASLPQLWSWRFWENVCLFCWESVKFVTNDNLVKSGLSKIRTFHDSAKHMCRAITKVTTLCLFTIRPRPRPVWAAAPSQPQVAVTSRRHRQPIGMKSSKVQDRGYSPRWGRFVLCIHREFFFLRSRLLMPLPHSDVDHRPTDTHMDRRCDALSFRPLDLTCLDLAAAGSCPLAHSCAVRNITARFEFRAETTAMMISVTAVSQVFGH